MGKSCYVCLESNRIVCVREDEDGARLWCGDNMKRRYESTPYIEADKDDLLRG